MKNYYTPEYDEMKSGRNSTTFRRNTLPPTSETIRKKTSNYCCFLLTGPLLGLLLNSEDGTSIFVPRLSWFLPDYTASRLKNGTFYSYLNENHKCYKIKFCSRYNLTGNMKIYFHICRFEARQCISYWNYTRPL